MNKQYKLLELVLFFGDEAARALGEGVYLRKILALEVREQIARAKYIKEDSLTDFDGIRARITADINALTAEEAAANA
jgi:V/A-type H+-transporting ATPase subunit A